MLAFAPALALALVLIVAGAAPARAQTPVVQVPVATALQALFSPDFAERLAALEALAQDSRAGASGGASGRVLGALDQGRLVRVDGRVLVLEADGHALDALTGRAAGVLAGEALAGAEKPLLNNRLRRLLGAVLAGGALLAPDAALRRQAIADALRAPGQVSAARVAQALAAETQPELRRQLDVLVALQSLPAPDAVFWQAAPADAPTPPASPSVAAVLAALNTLALASAPEALPPLRRLAQQAGLTPVWQARVQAALATHQTRHARAGTVNTVFSGLSAASVLLLAALGLAITYGLMGVINMAHGEMLMIGAYATYLTQNAVSALAPAWLDQFIWLAIPASFLAAALVGMLIEFLVLRHLYGKPVDTLLATFGVSLILMQTVRTLFGAQNVTVANPSWLAGAQRPLQDWLPGLQLLNSRIAVLVFAVAVLLAVWLLLTRTRLGLFVRAVTQNRRMASCVGVRTRRIDNLAFGLGSGTAGLGGCALSQIGPVGPDMGQGHIIDSFMVVVLGGVGQLAGTLVASTGLGLGSKLAEPHAGAVLTKIALLLLIVLFIQKRPQGLFAPKGRSAEA